MADSISFPRKVTLHSYSILWQMKHTPLLSRWAICTVLSCTVPCGWEQDFSSSETTSLMEFFPWTTLTHSLLSRAFLTVHLDTWIPDLASVYKPGKTIRFSAVQGWRVGPTISPSHLFRRFRTLNLKLLPLGIRYAEGPAVWKGGRFHHYLSTSFLTPTLLLQASQWSCSFMDSSVAWLWCPLMGRVSKCWFFLPMSFKFPRDT